MPAFDIAGGFARSHRHRARQLASAQARSTPAGLAPSSDHLLMAALCAERYALAERETSCHACRFNWISTYFGPSMYFSTYTASSPDAAFFASRFAASGAPAISAFVLHDAACPCYHHTAAALSRTG